MPTLRECLLNSIAQYDAAPSIADRKEAAVVVVERVRMYLAAEDQTPRKLKRLGELEDEDTYSNPNTSTKLQVHITGRRPFTYSGVDYPTVQHAFQAQKFSDESNQERIATLTLMEAVSEGRRANIDVSEWDANKAKLMYSLLKAQAKQHEEMAGTLVESQGISIHVNPRGRRLRRVLADHAAEPKMYAKLGEKLAESAAETDDDPAPKRKAAAAASPAKAGKACKTE
eukprot:CAMPEP_0115832080 /NCGR_PEP_ID=MMETSP0287-20121206/2472_1 /TAXON_ID=412157 /ORGANISM="Chrysochromulina rotalis, Strain UIO044" /LENGTH=227 /DNA_ID=CAMNT_0003285451 /DNA_START=16 /DNA_END=700 /DNA_ORIENTATION=-